jgi:hypothetical protein
MQAAAPATPSVTAASRGDVVVVGVPLADLKRALELCLARRCPPDEDIAHSLAYAEAQFLAGDYRKSRATLTAARGRNRRFAASLPIEVSDLHRATALLSGLNGSVDAERIATFDVVDALKAGLDRADVRIMMARLDVGSMFAHEGRLDDALDRYRTVVEQARAANLPVVEGMALFRRAALLSAVASEQPSFRGTARRAVAEVMHTTDPALAPIRNGARLIAANLMRPHERSAAVKSIMTSLEPVDTDRPVLAYSPPIDLRDAGFGVASGDSDAQWADVEFVVADDGTVRDIQTVRSSNKLNEKFLAIAMKSLSARRYMPMKSSAGEQGRRRVERYSFVSNVVVGGDADAGDRSRSRVPVRSSERHAVVVDITQDAKTPAPGA